MEQHLILAFAGLAALTTIADLIVNVRSWYRVRHRHGPAGRVR